MSTAYHARYFARELTRLHPPDGVDRRLVQESCHQNPPRLMLAACGRVPFSRATSRLQYRYFASMSVYRTDWPSTVMLSRLRSSGAAPRTSPASFPRTSPLGAT